MKVGRGAEENLHGRQSNLSDSHGTPDVAAYLAAIVASSDDVIVSKTLDGVITSWNPGAERVLGYTAAEAVGKHIKMIIPPERWAEEDDVLARIRRGERVDHFETVRRAKDGRLLNISLTVSPIKDQNGKIVGASKVARDITERKQAEREFGRLLLREKESRAQAEEANRLKDEFLAVVSHELRTPLNAIVGWASLLRMRKLDDETMRAIETIQRNAQTQNQLIGDLLDVSRIVSGKLRLNIRPFELISVVNAAIEVIQPSADAKSIRVQTELEPAAGPVVGDPDRLQQIFWNLLSNAVKFTPTQGEIRIQLRRTKSHVEFVVADTGKGIEPKVLPFIFERFRQADSSTTREHGGLGPGAGYSASPGRAARGTSCLPTARARGKARNSLCSCRYRRRSNRRNPAMESDFFPVPAQARPARCRRWPDCGSCWWMMNRMRGRWSRLFSLKPAPKLSLRARRDRPSSWSCRGNPTR